MVTRSLAGRRRKLDRFKVSVPGLGVVGLGALDNALTKVERIAFEQLDSLDRFLKAAIVFYQNDQEKLDRIAEVMAELEPEVIGRVNLLDQIPEAEDEVVLLIEQVSSDYASLGIIPVILAVAGLLAVGGGAAALVLDQIEDVASVVTEPAVLSQEAKKLMIEKGFAPDDIKEIEKESGANPTFTQAFLDDPIGFAAKALLPVGIVFGLVKFGPSLVRSLSGSKGKA